MRIEVESTREAYDVAQAARSHLLVSACRMGHKVELCQCSLCEAIKGFRTAAEALERFTAGR